MCQSKTILFLAFFSILRTSAVSQIKCEQKIDKEGIQVFLCESEGSPFKTIRVHFEAKTTLKQYAAGVLDVPNYPKWQTNTINPRILDIKNKKEMIYYCEIQTPWPIDNRDLVFHLTMNQDTTTKVLTVTLTQLPEFIPVKKDIIRIPKAQSTLTVTPIDKSTVSVNYIIHIDPGGEIPAFIANLFSTQTPWATFKNYRDLLSKNTFTGSAIDFITNY